MRKSSDCRFLLFVLPLIISVILFNENVLAESSGKFMLVETPESKMTPDFLVVEKHGGKKSLIKVEEHADNEQSVLTKKGKTNVLSI